MRVNLAVCGRYHYHNYARYLDQAGVLSRFYYSHRRTTDAASLGIAPARTINLWPKEYLIHGHGMLTQGWMMHECAPVYATLWQMGALWRWRPCDILHLMMDGSGGLLMNRARREGSRIIGDAVTCHPDLFAEIMEEEYDRLSIGPQFRRPALWKRQLEELANSDCLLAASQFVRESFAARGYRRDRIVVLPYAVDPRLFRPLPSDDTKKPGVFRVLCVGALTPYKGQVYLLEAWKKLRLPNAELTLIGAMSYQMKAILRRYGNLFKYIPFVPNARLYEHYGRSSVFVLPSLEDGFALATVEAMACGVPVITTVNNGAADVITHGEDGFVVPIRWPEAIAQRLELLYRNEELRREMSRAALDKARSELSWQRYAKRLCALYRSVLGGTDAETPASEGAGSAPARSDCAL